MPLYKQAGNYVGWNQFTLANVPNDPTSSQLWAPAIFAYIYSAYFCYLLFAEYKNFVEKRVLYLVNGDLDTPPQTYYTILIEKIPAALRSEPQLREFFEKLFPGQIYSVEIAVDISELDALVQQGYKIRNSLEKSDALLQATKIRPTCWVSHDDGSLLETIHPVEQTKFAEFFGYTIVDSIDYYCQLLQSLNESIKKLQQKYDIQVHTINNNVRNHKGLNIISGGESVRGRFETGFRDHIRDKTGAASIINKLISSNPNSHSNSNDHLDDSKRASLLDSDTLGHLGGQNELLDRESNVINNATNIHWSNDRKTNESDEFQLPSDSISNPSRNRSSNDSKNSNNQNPVLDLGNKLVNAAGIIEFLNHNIVLHTIHLYGV